MFMIRHEDAARCYATPLTLLMPPRRFINTLFTVYSRAYIALFRLFHTRNAGSVWGNVGWWWWWGNGVWGGGPHPSHALLSSYYLALRGTPLLYDAMMRGIMLI